MNTKQQFQMYGALSVVVFVMTALAMPTSRAYFSRFYGGMHPLLAVTIASAVGAGSLRILQMRAGFKILAPRTTGRGIAVSAVMATFLGAVIILVDLFLRYPENTNVPMPQALAFYPAVGFVAEVVFYLVPLAILQLLLGRIRNNRGAWLAMFLTAVAEPTFQVLLGAESSAWAALVTWVHVFAIACFQLYVLRRYDFTSMYAFRLIYYGYWHIVWGVIRLEVLF